MTDWADIVSEYQTWDQVVECCDTLTADDRERIEKLGYYGHVVKPLHAKWLHEEKRWEPSHKYLLTLIGPEGVSEQGFDTLEEAGAYIKPRIQWCSPSGESFKTDYINYYLHGFSLMDVGIDP